MYKEVLKKQVMRYYLSSRFEELTILLFITCGKNTQQFLLSIITKFKIKIIILCVVHRQ